MRYWSSRTRIGELFSALVIVLIWASPGIGQEQGWTSAQQKWWYTVSQGSRLLPATWFLALELPDSRMKVLDAQNIDALKYLPNDRSTLNPDGLPVGFVRDAGDDNNAQLMCSTFPTLCANGVMRQDWIGLNCSACHTNEISYRTRQAQVRRIRIDGGATLADFQTLLEQILSGLKQTLSDPEKFDRFAGRVLVRGGDEPARTKLKAELGEVVAWEQALADTNFAPLRYGYGRLDAQGHILNKISLLVGAPSQLKDFPADAPASYPHIWNAPQHSKVQWNGIAPNNHNINLSGKDINLGALGRNTGEVLGVFAHLDIERTSVLGGFQSSLRLPNMIRIERQLSTLRSPKWPADLPIDRRVADAGKDLFDRKCKSCHLPILGAEDTRTKFAPKMVSIAEAETDVWLACNTFLHRAKSGRLEGTSQLFGHSFADVDSTKDMLIRLSGGAIIWDFGQIVRQAYDDIFTPDAAATRPDRFPASTGAVEILPGIPAGLKKSRAEQCLRAASRSTFEAAGLAYKGRPLNGIWATAPYLHNGSVPTLYDLLLPAKVRNTRLSTDAIDQEPSPRRPDRFCVGSPEFDPKKVGFQSAPDGDGKCPAGTFEFNVQGPDGVPILGNYNSGHNYGTDLSGESRWALVEYLKGL